MVYTQEIASIKIIQFQSTPTPTQWYCWIFLAHINIILNDRRANWYTRWTVDALKTHYSSTIQLYVLYKFLDTHCTIWYDPLRTVQPISNWFRRPLNSLIYTLNDVIHRRNTLEQHNKDLKSLQCATHWLHSLIRPASNCSTHCKPSWTNTMRHTQGT